MPHIMYKISVSTRKGEDLGSKEAEFPKWMSQMKDPLKTDDRLRKFATITALAEGYLENNSKVGQGKDAA